MFTAWQFDSVLLVTWSCLGDSKRPINKRTGAEASFVDLNHQASFQSQCGK